MKSNVFHFPFIAVVSACLIILAVTATPEVSQAQSGSRSMPAQSGTRGVPVQGGSGTQVTPGNRQSQTGSGAAQGSGRQTFEEKLWNYLQTAQYRNWAPLPGTSADAFAGQQPHGAMVKVYANRTAAGNPDQLPHGSIIIKENLGPDGKALMAVTLMYRVPNYDAANGDWYWAKYEPDGAVSQMNGMNIAGKVGMCVECHSSAGGNDYSFSNDR